MAQRERHIVKTLTVSRGLPANLPDQHGHFTVPKWRPMRDVKPVLMNDKHSPVILLVCLGESTVGVLDDR